MRVPLLGILLHRSRLLFLVLGLGIIALILPSTPAHPAVRRLLPSRLSPHSLDEEIHWEGLDEEAVSWKGFGVNDWLKGNERPTLLITGGAGQLGTSSSWVVLMVIRASFNTQAPWRLYPPHPRHPNSAQSTPQITPSRLPSRIHHPTFHSSANSPVRASVRRDHPSRSDLPREMVCAEGSGVRGHQRRWDKGDCQPRGGIVIESR